LSPTPVSAPPARCRKEGVERKRRTMHGLYGGRVGGGGWSGVYVRGGWYQSGHRDPTPPIMTFSCRSLTSCGAATPYYTLLPCVPVLAVLVVGGRGEGGGERAQSGGREARA